MTASIAMSLLPKSHAEFSHAGYWERFFRKRGDKAFEWYGEYGELCGILHKYIKPGDKVLNVGCGNSTLSADLYDVGYKNILNIDISDVVIKQMSEKNAKQRPDMKFLKMDVYGLDLDDNEYSVVLDKGTLDAIMTDSSAPTIENVEKMFGEISRILKVGGRYVCISLAQEHIASKVLEYFSEAGWMVRVCRVDESEKEEEKRDFHMPVFVFVLTKFKKMPNMKPILEMAYFDDRIERLGSQEEVKAAIKEMQHYGIVRQQLENKHQTDEEISLELFSSASNTPRYTLHVVDRPQTSGKKFAVFIVPEGRETEWLFSSVAGRKQLRDSAGFERLVVVTLHRDHTYSDLESIQNELSGKVMELAPPGLSAKKQVPFLSVGNDINKRAIKHRGTSEMSGKFVVEDVDCDSQIHRRLIFLSNDRVIQSSARLKKEMVRRKGGKNKAKQTVDLSYLQCSHHGIMSAGLSLLHDFKERMEAGPSVLVIGLGGGGLPSFLRKQFPTLKIDAIEIDPAIVKVATEWFGLVPDENLRIHVADGIDFVKEAEKKDTKWDVVMLDVNSHDASVGMSCPPRIFVEKDFLQSMRAVLAPKGILMINLACRDQDLKSSVLDEIKSVYGNVRAQNVPEEVNEVLFAMAESSLPNTGENDVKRALNLLQDSAKKHSKGAEVPKLTDMLDGLAIL